MLFSLFNTTGYYQPSSSVTVVYLCPLNSNSTQGSSSCTCLSGYLSSGSDATLTCTLLPATQPSAQPSTQPSSRPSRPSSQPSSQPSKPSSQPSSQPSRQPTRQPSSQPSNQPTSQPSGQPTLQPSSQPTSLCPKGYFSSPHAVLPMHICSACAVGSYSSVFGATQCTLAITGNFWISLSCFVCLMNRNVSHEYLFV